MKKYIGRRIYDKFSRGVCTVDVQTGKGGHSLFSSFVKVSSQSKTRKRGNPQEEPQKTDPIQWDWGYRGIYPYGLAKSILDDLFSEHGISPDPDTVSNFHTEVIAKLPYDGWELTENEIYEYLSEKLEGEMK